MSRREYLIENFRWIEDEHHPAKVCFTFDGYNIYHIFKDYPDALSPLEKEVFDELNPDWASEDINNELSLAEENLRRKEVRCKSRTKQRARERRRYKKIASSNYCKPSIYPDYDYAGGRYVPNGRIKRGKNSNFQRYYKKYSNRKIRRMPINATLPKGNGYRKEFDYWWTWD